MLKNSNYAPSHKQTDYLIAICKHRDEKEQVLIQEEAYTVACSIQNILLSMKLLNNIGKWGTGKIAFSQEMKEYLNLGVKDKCLGYLQLFVLKKGLPDLRKEQISPNKNKVVWR